jgi:bacterioferritin B
MASERFVAALTEQIAREFAAAHQYVAIGNYYAAETYPQLSTFFYGQAEEEREHAMKMVNYLIDRGVQPDIGGVQSPKGSFGDHVEPIRLALEQEQQVTIKISELFEIARETRDYASEQFIHWFLEEQVEEEAAIGDLLAVAERTVSVPMLLEEYLARDKPGARPE